MIRHIKDHNENLLAIIVSNEPVKEGINFYTTDDLSLQVGAAYYPTGKSVDAHTHNDCIRTIKGTGEVVIMKKGKYRVDFYDDTRTYIKSYMLVENDIIVFIQGSHGFKSIEDVELIEVKQGPYMGNEDKTRFLGIDDKDVRY